MAKTNQRIARKPATKYPNLQKKLQKGKVKAAAAKNERTTGKHGTGSR